MCPCSFTFNAYVLQIYALLILFTAYHAAQKHCHLIYDANSCHYTIYTCVTVCSYYVYALFLSYLCLIATSKTSQQHRGHDNCWLLFITVYYSLITHLSPLVV